jgi:transketolase
MNLKALEAAATSVRSLSMDGVQAANSGHPGLPMGCAELGVLLYGEVMNHNPEKPEWINRDRFVLSAGHGSMFLYSLLHLSGYDLALEELKKFRQVGSRTPGHPEYGWTPGVETTTGPLGAGLSEAVGMAAAETFLAATFNTGDKKVVDHYTYVLSGDGCMMEGISSEASSLAGHLGLGKLIVFYDSNKISIEGSTDLAFTEDVAARYRAYGWQVLEGDMYDVEKTAALIGEAKAEAGKPSLIILPSVIGKGSPNMAGSHKVHGAPLGDDEIKATRKNLGIDENAAFFVHPDATSYFKEQLKARKKAFADWSETFEAWAKENPELKAKWDLWFSGDRKAYAEKMIKAAKMPDYKPGDSVATRKASGAALQALAASMENLLGGSADLAPSNNTALTAHGEYGVENRAGRTFHFGVREHAMGALANGLSLHGGLRSFCATFLVFADYMRPQLRLSAIMKEPVIYVFTHDSIFLGEDGPTHQPIEHAASLRIIPNLEVFRPADAEEANRAWELALLRDDGPCALLLTRQNLPVLEKADARWRESMASKGAYIVKESEGSPAVVVVATGSEVSMALEAIESSGRKDIRLVSMPVKERFLALPGTEQQVLLPAGAAVYAAEAGVSDGWEAVTGSRDRVFGINRFGESGPGDQVAQHLGFTAKAFGEILKKA